MLCSILSLRAQTFVKPAVKVKDTSFAVITDKGTFQACEAELKAYQEILGMEGLPTFIVYNEWNKPEDVKKVIVKLYKKDKLEGVVFVGDIPIPMLRKAQHMTSAFKMDEKNNDWRDSSVPSDRFYDDFDLQFDFLKQDSVENNFFYYNLAIKSPQQIRCDIYSARVKAVDNGEEPHAQISRYFKKVVAEHQINNKLDQLVKSKILTRYYFTSEEGKGIYRIYCLEKMGKYLLTSKEIECKWQQTDNVKPVAMIKKRLAGNQTIIAYLRKVKAFDSYVVKPALTAKISGKIFKATGGSVKLTKNNKSITFLFEVIRRESDWEKKLADKMAMYKEFYENFVPGDSGFSAMPQLIFVCEDDRHTAEVFKEIVKNKLEIPQIKSYFTTDLRQNNDTLENTLIEFKIDETTKKYKMFNVEAKILGI